MGFRDAALAASRAKVVQVADTPWGRVEFRALRGDEFDALQAVGDEAGEARRLAELVRLSAYDPESGERAFAEDDVPYLAAGNSAVLVELAAHANAANGLAGGKAATPGAAGGGGSPASSGSPPGG